MIKENIYNTVKACIKDFDLIAPNDRILVGVSGGKDSMTCYTILKSLSKELSFTLNCAYISYPVKELPNNIKEYLGENLIEKNVSEVGTKLNCSICSHLRRIALLECAKENNCNKIVLAHNFEDNVETCMLNVFTGNKNLYLEPKRTYFNEYYLIRPMLYVREDKIKSFVKRNNIPVCENQCENLPNCGRILIRKILKELSCKYTNIYENIYKLKTSN